MNERSLRVLEWPKIKAQLQEHTSFSLGKERVGELAPSTSLNEVEYNQQLTTEALAILWHGGDPPFGGAKDIFALIDRAKIGGMLEPGQLLEVGGVLYCSHKMRKYLTKAEGLIKKFTQDLHALPHIRDEINRCIEEDGRVKDSASPELSRLRQRMNTLANKVRDKLDAIIHSTANQKILQQSIVTIRNGRYVVPIKQEYRGRFSGIVHDQSGSGATLFVEPAAVVELNNELRLVEQAEQQEIKRILNKLTLLVQTDASQLELTLQVLAELDFIFARAKYSRRVNGSQPMVNDQGVLHIKQGRHPLLTGEVVPSTLWLGETFKMLVVTGPNTGGKTVTLKTVGLFCLMAQAGLHIPALDGSKIPVFQGIYADIGDEQSIEQSLSTFSSHMTHIVDILKHANSTSLVLLDELGAGTDPGEGAALATALLDYLRERGVSTVATTHYSQLKNFAYSHEEVENASVEFDVATLSPTYHLAIGIPGRSNALAIAKRLGLNDEVINKAQALLGDEQVHVEDIIGEMESNRREAERARQEAEELRSQYNRLKERYQERLERMEKQRLELLEQAKEEAREVVKATRKEMDELIGALRREGQADLEGRIKEQRERLYARQDSLKKEESKKQEDQGPQRLKVGEEVRIKSLRQQGIVLEPANSHGDVLVQAGIMKVTVQLGDLERLASPTRGKNQVQKFTGGVGKGKSETIRAELDLRGTTIDEALPQVDKYLDDAFLASLSRVTLIHGKGTGALRQAVTEQLKTHPHVKSYRLGGMNEGGSGVTVVELNIAGN